jgi:hypothetical protein
VSRRGFDAERANRAGDGKRTLFVSTGALRVIEAAEVRVIDVPLSDEAIARCRAKARARRMS